MRKRKFPNSRAKGRSRRPAAAAVDRSKTVVAAGDLPLLLERIPRFPLQQISAAPPHPRLQMMYIEAPDDFPCLEKDDGDAAEKDFILSQDFFCTPDYITPEIPNNLELNKENFACPKSPEKSSRNKRHRQDFSPCTLPSSNIQLDKETVKLQLDDFGQDEVGGNKLLKTSSAKKQRYVSQSAVALRCRVMPPPCIKNPYLIINPLIDLDVFGDRKEKFSGLSPSIGREGLSRYRTDFHELEKIGIGNFSHVFKVLKRIDGCLYAVKCSIKQLHNDMERRHALREVQALAALGHHGNIVGYHSSWFENEKLYIQMELCEHSLSIDKGHMLMGGEILEVLYQPYTLQIAKALCFMHDRGIAHMDVKPENIYVKNSVYKLGDFGCAILTDRSLPIEEGDSRYMPQEILNDKYEHLDKVDIFSLGATTYELAKGSPLPESGSLFCKLREGKIPLLPGQSMQLQSLLKVMMDPDPVKRPSAQEIIENPIFDRIQKKADTVNP
ncbi:Wee1-like protein kinase [Apostasia shenzhenica]|uniref:Wee1-like protein kinase n=1 Tax=Apostasia shenzhenica TaxID=1088818 RepID=A0A2I0B6R0_9ASPA|nr:Wee1-like protein kinase [Apostasia shenzhenica]